MTSSSGGSLDIPNPRLPTTLDLDLDLDFPPPVFFFLPPFPAANAVQSKGRVSMSSTCTISITTLI
eukprot:CAMPEP_0204641828 /NCGR_PEP_ID=MMETSP0717-20131115/51353_1 /ASSEMBLY_ACC=CAM_ASM_000666 /TAXON_ID=230516 /ORGANISM="Chaetoceros curvisetus" /LENGTH=65 /DNA_ID=CAMNT_0051662539 /DNA_START=823 /DNA_END=1017 /DNA_ORIENTATION=-